MADFKPKPKAEGTFAPTGEEVKFNKVWGGHTFSDSEIEQLLNGDVIEFDTTSARTGKDWHAKGQLEHQTFHSDEKNKDYPFWGFKPDFD